jgi:hypothetical protein
VILAGTAMSCAVSGHDERVGALVTLDLPADSPIRELPWIITIGPLDEDDEWDPVVCGPYERVHALALAQVVVADEDLMAVVEPLLTLTDVGAIRDEVSRARAAAPHSPDDEAEAEPETRHVPPVGPPSEAEVRAGIARVVAGLPQL